MKKISIISSLSILGLAIVALIGTAVFPPHTPSQLPAQTSPFPSNTESTDLSETTLTYTDNADIYSIDRSGLITYLIIRNNTSKQLTKLNIQREIGGEPQELLIDELGNTCQYSSNVPLTRSFYFTTPATYTISYTLTSITVINKVETYTTENFVTTVKFNPEIVEQRASELTLTDNTSQIIKADQNYYFLKSGEVDVRFNTDLYDLTVGDGLTKTDDDTIIIPANRYGKTSISFKSHINAYDFTFEFYVMTLRFDIDFYSDDFASQDFDPALSLIDKTNQCFGTNNYYVFNQDISVRIHLDESTNRKIDNSTLDETAYEELYTAFSFELSETLRSESNTASLSNNKPATELDHSTYDNSRYLYLENIDHSIFEFNIKFTESNINYSELSELYTFKIITKVPFDTTHERYDFALYIQQYDYNTYEESVNYLNQCLNGYLKTGTIIQNTISDGFSIIRLSENTLIVEYQEEGFSVATKTLDSTQSKLDENNASKNDYNIRIKKEFIEMNDGTFESFYCFDFKVDLYSGTKEIAGSTAVSSNLFTFADGTLSISPDYSEFTSVYSMLTHNGTQYENITNFQADSTITFTDAGTYTLELFSMPSYEMAKTSYNITPNNATRFYYAFNFTIDGASISAVDSAGKTIINNGFTPYTTKLNIQLAELQLYTLYKNNEIVASAGTSISDLEQKSPGTYRVDITDVNGKLVKTYSFTILNNLYQGYSVNKQNNHISFTISKLVSEMPVKYEILEEQASYHLLEEGTYKFEVEFEEHINFMIDDHESSTVRVISDTFSVVIKKSNFKINFATGKSGARITENVVIGSIYGVNLYALVVFLDGEVVKIFDANQLKSFETLDAGEKTFSSNGTYTVRLIDTFGNTYEAQITKYYKTNFALILLIIIIAFIILYIALQFVKHRRKINVK